MRNNLVIFAATCAVAVLVGCLIMALMTGCTGYWGRRGKPAVDPQPAAAAVQENKDLPPVEGVLRSIRKGPGGAPAARRER